MSPVGRKVAMNMLKSLWVQREIPEQGATVDPLPMRVVFTGDPYLMETPGAVLALSCSPVLTSYHPGSTFWEFSALLVEGAGKASSLS